MKRKSGFTLLELVVVIIIIAILASLGFSQYTKMMERGRASEARITLGQLRSAELAYYLEYNAYTTIPNLFVTGAQTACANQTISYFSYDCALTGTCTAARCDTGTGKLPSATTSYTVILAVNGTFTGTGPP